MIYNFLEEIKSNNSSNHKLLVLRKYKDSEAIKKLLAYTYNKVTYNFYINGNRVLKTLKEVPVSLNSVSCTLEDMFKLLDTLNSGLRGNDALYRCLDMYRNLSPQDAEIFICILNRDLKLGINYKQINKVHKNLIPKPQYSRCDVYSEKIAKAIKFPAFIELKVDGTYREFLVLDGTVNGRTRSGEEYQNEVLEQDLLKLKDGYYFGELIIGDNNRMKNNGLINSDNPPNDKIDFIVWDYLTTDEYSDLSHQRSYKDRLQDLETQLKNLTLSHLKLIEYYVVQDKESALQQVSKWMGSGLEGGVLKDFNYQFKNGTSKLQLKIKLKVDADLRITGFTEGTLGTKREGKIGAIQYQNDEGTVQGQCSGFSDAELEYFTTHKEELLGKILTVEFCDVVKSPENDYYALMHPRFKGIRTDKTETDTLERILEMRDMARSL